MKTTQRKHKPSAVRFFYSHAGYSWKQGKETRNQGKWRCARSLAAAEKLANELELKVEWDYEPDSWMNYAGDPEEEYRAKFESGEWEVLNAVVRGSCGEVLASLGGIVLTSSNWTPDHERQRKISVRVFEAELMDEAIATIEKGQ